MEGGWVGVICCVSLLDNVTRLFHPCPLALFVELYITNASGTPTVTTEPRSCVKVEAAVLGSIPSLISFCGRKATLK